MDEAKPFCIAKREVWEAYKRVKENRGAAGVDEQTIDEFEKDLKNNLYRLWNRMSSGSYMPPPVRRVDIPKGVFRGRRGDLIKCLWSDGQGLCLFANYLASYCTSFSWQRAS